VSKLEKRIDKLEGVCKPQRQPIPSLVMLDKNGEPVTERDAEVLHLNREAEARGEDVRLIVLRIPAGVTMRD